MSQETITCPGCGALLPQQGIEGPARYNTSGECYAAYSELSGYTMGKQDIHFMHQHAIDTYSAQHAGSDVKTITVAFSLIGLYYAIEHGYTGKQVQRVHMLLAQQKITWPSLSLPKKPYSFTVIDVLHAAPGKHWDDMLKKWMLDVWMCWEHQHTWIRSISQTLLH
ncbi:DUF5946 family protein [Bacillus sp. 165]|uniref:DUF5946 family protein n=1 Tax=Bacillus sp. 165 TaxID=1529117 RepID=UPI001ADBD08C|nr:DUF5946 family protein [Bacillus sp. 165]MBO9129371.1 serine/threonine protein kinase [Bacillus sp. 165]